MSENTKYMPYPFYWGDAPIDISFVLKLMILPLLLGKFQLKVLAVNAEGFFAGVVPSAYEDGILKLTLGGKFTSMYYLI